MKSYRVVFDEAALQDLTDFLDAVVIKAGEAVARRYVDQVIAYCRGFATFPERGLRRPERPGLRTVGWRRRATTAFRVQGDTVTILRVLFRGRNLVLPGDAG